LAKLHHAQQTARKITVQNNDHHRQQYVDQHAKHTVTKFPTYEKDDNVWVKIGEKNKPNPKLCPKYERGIIMERVQHNAYKVKRIDRAGKKVKTLSVLLLKPRYSANPPPGHDEQELPPRPEQDQQQDQRPPPPQVPPRPRRLKKAKPAPRPRSDSDSSDSSGDDQGGPGPATDTDDDFTGFPDQEPAPLRDELYDSAEEDGSETDTADDEEYYEPEYSYHDAAHVSPLETTVSVLTYLDGTVNFDELCNNGNLDFPKFLQLLGMGYTLMPAAPAPVSPPQQNDLHHRHQDQQGGSVQQQQRRVRQVKRGGKKKVIRPDTPLPKKTKTNAQAAKDFVRRKSTRLAPKSLLNRLAGFLQDPKKTPSPPKPSSSTSTAQAGPATRARSRNAYTTGFDDYLNSLKYIKKTKVQNEDADSDGSGISPLDISLDF
jgi:hypothetical protein